MKRISLISLAGATWIACSLALVARGAQDPADGFRFGTVDRTAAVSPTAASDAATVPFAAAPSDVARGDKPAMTVSMTSEAADEPAAAGPAPCERKPWHLPQPLEEHYGIHFSGWLEQGITANDDNPRDHLNGPVATNDHNEYQMNQLWLTAERECKTGGCGWAFGGRVDVMLGTDWRFGIDNGLETRINGFHDQAYGMVLPQFYGEIGYNDLTVKIGHYAGILDYEVVAAPGNAFYSHSYSYPYSTPVLTTGWQADYKVTDQFSIQGGMNLGWNNFEDNNDSWDFMGGFRWRSCDDRTTVAFAIDNGPQDPLGLHNRFVYSLVIKQVMTDNLTYVLVHDLGVEDAAAVGGGQAEWGSLCQYFLYKINEKWSANLRTEFFRDPDGARIAGPGNIPGVGAWDGHSFQGTFDEITLGLNWRPRPNMVLRPELRYDWYNGQTGFDHGIPGQLPFNNGKSSTQLLAATDFIIMF